MKPLALVVENDSGTQRLLSVLLNRLGYQTDAVAHGSDALLLLEEIRYDIAFVDLCLPCTSGPEVLRWMKDNHPDDLTRTLMLSSAFPQVTARVQEDFPQVRVLRKPFDLADVISAADMARPANEREALTAAQDFARRSVTAGAKSGVLVRNDGADLSLICAFGYSQAAVENWFPLHLNDPYPLTTSVRDGQPHWIASMNDMTSEFSTLADVWREHGSAAVASVPLMRDGVVIGAAGWTFREPQLFDEAEQLAFLNIAAGAATAIEAA
jgi:two-component system, cell cycle response regulator CpdR